MKISFNAALKDYLFVKIIFCHKTCVFLNLSWGEDVFLKYYYK